MSGSIWRRRQAEDSSVNDWSRWKSTDEDSNKHFLQSAMELGRTIVQSTKLIIQQRPKKYVRAAIAFIIFLVIFIIYSILKSHGYMYGNPYLSRWCKYDDIPDYMLQKEPDEITIVTAYVNLGVFKKGQKFGTYRTPYIYKKWMQPLGKMTNPVLAFIEEDEDIAYFSQVRSCLPSSLTHIIKLKRNELWAFRLLEDIREIVMKPNYPKHYPNTAYPEFLSLTHAKYDLLQKALDLNPYNTPAFAWMDISYFKLLADDVGPFKLLPPEKFNTEKVGFTQAWPHDPNIDTTVVMRSNLVWASGGFILGINSTLQGFIKQYRWTVETLLKDGLANTDEQVLYAMYTTPMRHRYNKKQVKVKSYTCRQGQVGLWGQDVRHYCLGYVCKSVWEGIHKKH